MMLLGMKISVPFFVSNQAQAKQLFISYRSGGLRKGGPHVQIKWGDPFLYTPLYHDLSALAIKRNNAFYK